MKTDFSIQRINLLLRKDWIENKKKLAYGVLVILGVLFFFLLSSILWDTRFRTFTLYVLGSLGTFIAFCSYVNLMIHREQPREICRYPNRRHRGILSIPSHVLDWDGNSLNAHSYTACSIQGHYHDLARFHHAGVCRFLDVPLLRHIQEVCFRNRLWWIYIDNRFYHRDCLSMHKHLEYPAGYE